jgi:hypothetical protein
LCIAIIIGLIALPTTFAGGLAIQGRGQDPNRKARNVKPVPPEKGPPKMTLPNLDEVRGRRDDYVEIKPAVESSLRSKRKPPQQWDGRKVGDPGNDRPETTGAASAT